MLPAAPGPGDTTAAPYAPSQQPLDSGRQQTAPGTKDIPAGKLQPAFTEKFSSVFFITFPAGPV